MKIINMKQALDAEQITMEEPHSYYDSMKAIEAKGWTKLEVALKTPYGSKTHRASGLTKDGKFVLTGGIYCGAHHHGAAQFIVGINTPITCEKCGR